MQTCPRCSGLTPDSESSACLHCDSVLPRRGGIATVLLLATGTILLAACYGPAGKYNAPADPSTGSAAPTTVGSGSSASAEPAPPGSGSAPQ